MNAVRLTKSQEITIATELYKTAAKRAKALENEGADEGVVAEAQAIEDATYKALDELRTEAHMETERATVAALIATSGRITVMGEWVSLMDDGNLFRTKGLHYAAGHDTRHALIMEELAALVDSGEWAWDDTVETAAIVQGREIVFYPMELAGDEVMRGM